MSEHPNAFLFVWRESSFLDAVKTVLRPICRVTGHRWERHTHFESWDVGTGYEEIWWICNRCEAFSRTGDE